MPVRVSRVLPLPWVMVEAELLVRLAAVDVPSSCGATKGPRSRITDGVWSLLPMELEVISASPSWPQRRMVKLELNVETEPGKSRRASGR